MKLKFVVDQIESLDEGLRAFYVKTDDGKYRLDVDGYQDPGALIRAKQHERDAHNATKADLATANATISQLENDLDEARRARPKPGQEDAVEQQRASFETKIQKLKDDYAKERDGLMSHLSKVHRDDVATRLASEISDTPELLAPFILNRLQFELGASGPETRVLDADGKLSASTVEELREEFKTNAKFAALVRGPASSGGGAQNTPPGASGPKKPEEYTEAERVALHRTNPAEFQRLFGQPARH